MLPVTANNGDVEFTILTPHASHGNFGVADRTAPTVDDAAPDHLARNVSIKANPMAILSETMKTGTVSENTFILVKKGTSTPLGAKVTYSAATNKATLNPTRDLRPGTTYVVTLKGGVSDFTGNALALNMA